MSEKHDEDISTEQQSGIETNTEASIELDSREETKFFYGQIKQRLLNVNRWQHWAGKLTADFKLTDRHGVEVDKSLINGLIKKED